MHSRRSSDDIHRAAVRLAGQGRDCVLATVLEADGSTPCKAGSKALMDADGVLHGTIGGGHVEAETQQRVEETIKTGCPVVLDFNLHSSTIGDGDPICGGAMRILIDPATARHREAYASASAIRQSRQRGVLLTTIRGRTELHVAVEFLDEQAIQARGGFPSAEVVCSVLKREEPSLFVSESIPDRRRLEVLVEPITPAPVLLIVGGGHVGQAVAVQSSLVGFAIVVIDDRPEFTHTDLYPEGSIMRCGDIREGVAGFLVTGETYIVIVTRGHKHDADALAACIHEPAAYIGMIGSQRKVGMMRKAFVESGRATSAEFGRVFAPIGLDIGSVTVPEIAASIVAQLIAVRRTGFSPRISTG